MIRVVLVDDQEIVRAGLRLLLQSQTDMDIVGEAGDGAEALALCRQVSPHVVITTIELPGLNGFELARKLKAQRPTALFRDDQCGRIRLPPQAHCHR